MKLPGIADLYRSFRNSRCPAQAGTDVVRQETLDSRFARMTIEGSPHQAFVPNT